MKRILILPRVLASLLARLADALAATKTVQIKRAAFSPADGQHRRRRHDHVAERQTRGTTRSSRRRARSPLRSSPRTAPIRSRSRSPARTGTATRSNPTVTGTVKVAGAPPAVSLRHVAAADHVRRRGDASGQVNSKKAGEQVLAHPPALRPGLADRARDRDHGRRRHVHLHHEAEDPDELPGVLEDGEEPRRRDGGRARDLLRPAERVRHARLRRHVRWRGSRCNSSGSRSFGQWVTIKRVSLDLNSRARFRASLPSRRLAPADRDVREPGRRRLSRRLQPRDHLPAYELGESEGRREAPLATSPAPCPPRRSGGRPRPS